MQLEERELDFQKMKVEEVKVLRVDLNVGLKTADVENRLKQYGYNEVPEKKTNPAMRFLRKFWGLTAWMLEIIIILSWILQRYADLYIVTGLLFLNSILGFYEEQKASSTVESLKKKLQVNARVLRDGSWKVVPARELVPGDIARLRSGDFVSADIKIIMGDLEVDQSALTGESMAVSKTSDDILYSGSVVKRGEANGIITSTGVRTYFGRTAQLVQLARPKLHIEEVVSNVVGWLLVTDISLISLAIFFSILRGISLLELLPLILVLLLSAIPVALPAMFTVSMAIGSMELAKKGVLVTRLSASEDAATMNILCADKTGTITMNKLSIANVLPSNGFAEEEVVLYGALASQEANQDPIDLAFISLAKQKNLIDSSFVQKAFVPFDPKTRRTEALVQRNDEEFRIIKGAVNIVAHACRLDENAITQLEKKLEEFATKGYRTLAVAKTDDQNQPRLVGLVTLFDMPRPDSKQLIQELKGLGISVKMLTGDALPIAKEIARDVGLGENVIRVADLKRLIQEDRMHACMHAFSSWILSKIIRTLQIAAFVVLAFLFTGNYVVSAFAIILYFFMTDFVKIALSTDNLRWSKQPDTWNIAGSVKVAVILSLLVIVESFGLLYIGSHYFHLSANNPALYTFTFEILFYSAMFLIFNVREREHFWNSKPSKTLLTAMMLSIIAATIIATMGIPGLKALPLPQTVFVMIYSLTTSLILNDLVKWILVNKVGIRW